MDGFDTATISAMATELLSMKMSVVAMEDFNAEMTQIQHDLAEYGYEYGPDGELVQVHTPWAMGFVDEQGVPLS